MGEEIIKKDDELVSLVVRHFNEATAKILPKVEHRYNAISGKLEFLCRHNYHYFDLRSIQEIMLCQIIREAKKLKLASNSHYEVIQAAFWKNSEAIENLERLAGSVVRLRKICNNEDFKSFNVDKTDVFDVMMYDYDSIEEALHFYNSLPDRCGEMERDFLRLYLYISYYNAIWNFTLGPMPKTNNKKPGQGANLREFQAMYDVETPNSSVVGLFGFSILLFWMILFGFSSFSGLESWHYFLSLIISFAGTRWIYKALSESREVKKADKDFVERFALSIRELSDFFMCRGRVCIDEILDHELLQKRSEFRHIAAKNPMPTEVKHFLCKLKSGGNLWVNMAKSSSRKLKAADSPLATVKRR